MLKSVKYVLDENLNNLYRIYSIAKYELLSDGASAIDIEIIHGGNANGTT